jgi:hypothetical protein
VAFVIRDPSLLASDSWLIRSHFGDEKQQVFVVRSVMRINWLLAI